MGMQTSSAIKRVMTSSKGCISPICLFPIRRIIMSRARKMIAVRIMTSTIYKSIVKFSEKYVIFLAIFRRL